MTTEIRTFTYPEPAAAPPPLTRHAVVTRGAGGAIVTAIVDDGRTEIVAIERYPFAVEPIVERVRQLREDDPEAVIVVDEEGLGDALWEVLGKPRRPGWSLYRRHGRDREELTRTLLVAVAERRFSFAPGIEHAEAMRKALTTMTRSPREDGPGSELTAALALAVDDHRPPKPRIW